MKESKDIAPSVLVLIVTAHGDEEVAVEAFRSDARNYLKKPSGRNLLPGSETRVLKSRDRSDRYLLALSRHGLSRSPQCSQQDPAEERR